MPSDDAGTPWRSFEDGLVSPVAAGPRAGRWPSVAALRAACEAAGRLSERGMREAVRSGLARHVLWRGTEPARADDVAWLVREVGRTVRMRLGDERFVVVGERVAGDGALELSIARGAAS